MKTIKINADRPTITTKWPIEVQTHHYASVPSVYKVFFGTHYLIWKGKSLFQSCMFLAEGIERYLRTSKDEETDYLYHVCNHIKRTRCVKASVDVIENEFIRTIRGVESINGYEMLVAEQKLLDKAKRDPLCLNNNVDAYVSNWITKAHQLKFEQYLSDRKTKKS